MDGPASGTSAPRTNLSLTPTLGLALTVLTILIALLGLFVYKLLASPAPSLAVGQPAPAFQLETFAGEQIALSDLRGRGVVLNFWASWCGPCRTEAALLEAAWRQEQERGIVFIGIAYLDQLPAARQFLEEFDITYRNGRDKGSRISRQYDLLGVPETYFIDPDGILVYQHKGVLTDPAQFRQWLDRIRP